MEITEQVDTRRIYILVPNTVQVKQLNENQELFTKTIRMGPGRLMAQCSHVGRRWENIRAYRECCEIGFGYDEITTIVLSVRNSKELTKVTRELEDVYLDRDNTSCRVDIATFADHNPSLYGTDEKVHTATIIGPVEREWVDAAIGHLELYA